MTVNDSGRPGAGSSPSTPATGETVGVTRWDTDPRDVEAVAPAGPGEVWVGDIGDNRRVRDSIEVLRVPVGREDRTVEPERFELVYPDGAADAETLMTEPGTGRLVVVGKGVFGGIVYAHRRVSTRTGPTGWRRSATTIGLATDGSFFPDGRHLVVRNYGRAAVLTWPQLEELGSFELPPQEQGESIAVDERGRVLIGTEGAFSEVQRVRLPRAIDAAMTHASPTTPRLPRRPRARARRRPPTTRRARREAADDDGSSTTWLVGGAVALALLLVLLVATVQARPPATAAAEHPLGRVCRRSPAATHVPWPGCDVPLPTSRAGPGAGPVAGSSTSTSTGSGCRRRTPSGCATSSSRPRGATCG